MKFKTVFFIVFFLLSVYYISAENGNQPALSSYELIEKMKKATDPNEKLGKANTKVTEGEVIMPGQKIRASVKTFFKKPCKFMVEHLQPLLNASSPTGL